MLFNPFSSVFHFQILIFLSSLQFFFSFLITIFLTFFLPCIFSVYSIITIFTSPFFSYISFCLPRHHCASLSITAPPSLPSHLTITVPSSLPSFTVRSSLPHLHCTSLSPFLHCTFLSSSPSLYLTLSLPSLVTIGNPRSGVSNSIWSPLAAVSPSS